MENEYAALEAIKSDGLARILAPTPLGVVLGKDAGAIFTLGTENKSLYNPQDIASYNSNLNTLLFAYAQNKGLNIRELATDPTMQDVFNLALVHSSGITFKERHKRPEIIPLGELKERSGNSLYLNQFDPIYREAVERATGIDPGKKVFVHGDARPENVGRDPFGIRPLIDWANAHMGNAASELSSLEVPQTRKYLDWYNFVAGFRGGQTIDGEARDLVVCHDVIQPYRTGSFKIAKGRVEESKKDIIRLARNAQAYVEYFKN